MYFVYFDTNSTYFQQNDQHFSIFQAQILTNENALITQIKVGSQMCKFHEPYFTYPLC